jgi:peptidoglycan/xylan/chitin deacetylase (PgdA/CDA1 family)
MAGEKRLPPKSVMLTFDDGYLDNWVFVFPILRKYDAKATIFVNPEFVDPSISNRPQFAGAADGRKPGPDIAHLGFLNWSEMKAMEDSGLVDIQSHSLTHTWYFSGEKLVDFVQPGEKKYPWLAWNTFPDKKPFYLTADYSSMVPSGTPVYEHKKALICRRYLPAPAIAEKMVEYVRNEGETIFYKPNWWNGLAKKHDDISEKYKTDSRYESEDEYFTRVLSELQTSKKIIEDKLNKKVEFICWPGGGYNDIVCKAAKLAGYKSWPLSFEAKRSFRNTFNSTPCHIKRSPTHHRYKGKNGLRYGFANHRYFYAGLQSHKGSLIHKILFKMMRLIGVRLTRSSASFSDIGY